MQSEHLIQNNFRNNFRGSQNFCENLDNFTKTDRFDCFIKKPFLLQYYYSIKEISVGGRCVCNGHAYVCPPSKENSDLLQCQCEHNTAGDQCDQCKDGYVQKKWRPYTKDDPFECERCNCNGHSDKCHYDQEVADKVSTDVQFEIFKN